MRIKFNPKDFDKLRSFEIKMSKEFGINTYVGTEHATFIVYYSPKLKEMIKPYPQDPQFEYDVAQLSCEDCHRKEIFLTVPGETVYVCGDCQVKRKTKKK